MFPRRVQHASAVKNLYLDVFIGFLSSQPHQPARGARALLVDMYMAELWPLSASAMTATFVARHEPDTDGFFGPSRA